MLKYFRVTQGLLGSNTYVLYDDISFEGIIIDAGNTADAIKEKTEKTGIKIKGIVLTHAHFDHICYIDDYREAFPEIPVLIHEKDNPLMGNPRLNASCLFGSEVVYDSCDILLKEGDVLKLGEEEITVINTPGHTPGSICIVAGGFIFTGDTLFYRGFGRTDLGAGSTKELSQSIDRLYSMNPDLVVLPGHGTSSTIGREAADSPFFDF